MARPRLCVLTLGVALASLPFAQPATAQTPMSQPALGSSADPAAPPATPAIPATDVQPDPTVAPPAEQQPPPVPSGPPVYKAPPYTDAVAADRRAYEFTRFRRQLGVAVRLSAMFAGSALTEYIPYGIGPQLLLRLHPRFTLDLSVEYQHSQASDYPPSGSGSGSPNATYNRTDVPVVVGARLHLVNLSNLMSVYAAAAAGATYSQLTYDVTQPPDSHWFFELQGGGGVEFRILNRVLVGIDLRAVGRLRSENPADASVLLVNPTTGATTSVIALGNSSGAMFSADMGILLF